MAKVWISFFINFRSFFRLYAVAAICITLLACFIPIVLILRSPINCVNVPQTGPTVNCLSSFAYCGFLPVGYSAIASQLFLKIRYLMQLAKKLNNFTFSYKFGKMKRIVFIWLVFFLGISYQSFAKAGMAYDEKVFVWALVGFLFLVAGFFEGIDYLKKNGKSLLKRFRNFMRNKIIMLRNSH